MSEQRNSDSHHQTLRLETQPQDVQCNSKNDPIEFSITFLHCHDGYEILMILHGDVAMQFENSLVPLHHGDILLIPPYVMHFARQLSNETYYREVINIKEPFMDSLLCRDEAHLHLADCFYQNKNCLLHVDDASLTRLVSLSMDLQAELSDPSALENDIMVRSLLAMMLVRLNRLTVTSPDSVNSSATVAEQDFPDIIKTVFHYVGQHLAEKLLVTDIADSVHLNSIYLARLFKRYTGLTIQQYIIEKRLTEASGLLRKGQSPTDVCYDCGFGNYANFSRAFSRRFKISPKQYQMNVRATYTVV